ncbi:MAG: hypothetical protein HRU20_20275 [Pseudomonadales bacterium]|nr:hypothetical protein [Pseudomonadales bacterium]
MQCVQCKGYDLFPFELEKGLLGAQCKSCEGTLLSLFNYRFWAQNQPELATENQSDAIKPEPVEDQSTAKQCPKCSRLMVKYRLSHKVNNRLDYCLACDEVWLDKNEWSLFSQLKLPVQLPQLLTDSWQRQLREEQRAAALKKTYVDLVGEDDFSKVFEFKQWLDQHAHNAELRHFLTIRD